MQRENACRLLLPRSPGWPQGGPFHSSFHRVGYFHLLPIPLSLGYVSWSSPKKPTCKHPLVTNSWESSPGLLPPSQLHFSTSKRKNQRVFKEGELSWGVRGDGKGDRPVIGSPTSFLLLYSHVNFLSLYLWKHISSY